MIPPGDLLGRLVRAAGCDQRRRMKRFLLHGAGVRFQKEEVCGETLGRGRKRTETPPGRLAVDP